MKRWESLRCKALWPCMQHWAPGLQQYGVRPVAEVQGPQLRAPRPAQPCFHHTWTRLTVCRPCVSLPEASSSWKTASITWEQAGQAGTHWLLAPVAGSHMYQQDWGQLADPGAQLPTGHFCHLSTTSPVPSPARRCLGAAAGSWDHGGPRAAGTRCSQGAPGPAGVLPAPRPSPGRRDVDSRAWVAWQTGTVWMAQHGGHQIR